MTPCRLLTTGLLVLTTSQALPARAGVLSPETVGAVSYERLNDAPWGYLFQIRTRSVHPLHGDNVTLGRLAQSNVVFQDARVSRRHAEIRRDDTGVLLVDLHSTNGTTVNGRGLAPGESAPLSAGDVFMLANEEVLYHTDKLTLWMEALNYVLLGQVVHVRVPVAQDRTTRVLGTPKSIVASSLSLVDLEASNVEMNYGESGQGEDFFRVGEAALVGEVTIRSGALTLSLWGWDRSGGAISRRAAFTKVKHGELRIQPAGATEKERASRFDAGWSDRGTEFAFSLATPVLELVTEEEAGNVPTEFARDLVDQQAPPAARDAATVFGFRCRRTGGDPEFPALAAKARARAVRMTATERKASLTAEERAELEALLEEGRAWLKKAAELGAKDKALSSVELEIASAEKVLGGKL